MLLIDLLNKVCLFHVKCHLQQHCSTHLFWKHIWPAYAQLIVTDLQQTQKNSPDPSGISHKCLPIFHQMLSVDLVGNNITHISAGAFGNLSKCHIILLTSNKIFTITPTAFNRLPKLKVLLLRHNKISVIKANTFAELLSLERLDLGHNSLSIITNGTFFGLKQLRHLYLDNNSIWRIEQHSFAQLHSLMFISFENNKLEKLDPQTFVSLSQPFFMASFCPSTIDLHLLSWLDHEVKHETIYILPGNCFRDLTRFLFRKNNCGNRHTLFWLTLLFSCVFCLASSYLVCLSICFTPCVLVLPGVCPEPGGVPFSKRTLYAMLDLTTQILMSPTHIMMEGKQLSSAMKMEHGVSN